MLTLLAIAAFIVAGIYFLSKLDFEIGTGFTEAKKQAREGEFSVVEKKEEETKLIE